MSKNDGRLSGALQGRSTASAALSVKSHLSRTIYLAAMNSASESEKLMSADACEQSERRDQFVTVQQFALSAVIMASTALEARINEVCLRATDRSYRSFPKQSQQQVDFIGSLWDEIEPRQTLFKFQMVLNACGADLLAKGDDPYQSADSLVQLRNTLVHFKPEWDTKLDEHAKITARLRGKFEDARLPDEGDSRWFPNRCLGAGCARWACDTVRKFDEKFSERIGIRSCFWLSTAKPIR